MAKLDPTKMKDWEIAAAAEGEMKTVYQLAEAVKGSPLSERSMIFGQQVGLLLLVVLMSFAFYNDISRIFG